MKCRICKSDNVVTKYELFDDRYGYDGEFTLYGCKDCSHIWLDCSFTPEQLSNLYSTYYPYYPPKPIESGTKPGERKRRERRLTSNPFYEWLYGKSSYASQWVPKNVRLLDIGCGVGEGFNYHIARGCDVYGIEANEKARSIIEKSGYKIHIGLFDPHLYEPGFFDYVTMDQVLEHMVNPLVTIQGISRLLKPQGKLIITTPNAKGWGAKIFRKRWIHWHAPYHLHFFSRQSIEYLAYQAGFEIISYLTVTHSAWLNMQWMHLLTYPRKSKPSVFWAKHLVRVNKLSENYMLSGIINMLLSIISFFDKWRINDLVTRFFDMVHLGDNQVFILRKKDNNNF